MQAALLPALLLINIKLQTSVFGAFHKSVLSPDFLAQVCTSLVDAFNIFQSSSLSLLVPHLACKCNPEVG